MSVLGWVFTYEIRGSGFGSSCSHLNRANPLATGNLPGIVSTLASNKTSNVLDKLRRKISPKRAVRAGKEFTLFILNEDINDIIKIMKYLEDSGVFFDAITETVIHETKKTWIS